jgi:hypothetical protein
MGKNADAFSMTKMSYEKMVTIYFLCQAGSQVSGHRLVTGQCNKAMLKLSI